jgi:hypothetical protein
MARIKTNEFEITDENGKQVRPLEKMDYDMCAIDVLFNR